MKINLSYYIFPAFQEFSKQDKDNKKTWDDLYKNGTILLHKSLVRSVNLPPDWLIVSSAGRIKPVSDSRPVFGYEAIRIPLYLAWENNPKRLEFFRSFVKETAQMGHVPSFVNLDDGTFSSDEAGAGRSAIVARAARELGLTKQMVLLQNQSDRLAQSREENYYEAILALLARLF